MVCRDICIVIFNCKGSSTYYQVKIKAIINLISSVVVQGKILLPKLCDHILLSLCYNYFFIVIFYKNLVGLLELKTNFDQTVCDLNRKISRSRDPSNYNYSVTVNGRKSYQRERHGR